MNATRLLKSAIFSSVFSIAGGLGLVQVSLAGDIQEFPRTTADVVPVSNIQVENGTPNTVRLDLPPNMVPPGGSATPLFRPANDPNAHIFATMVLPETVLPTTTPPVGNEIAWWDVLIKVTIAPTAPPNDDVMISIDKDVLNTTPYHWTDFHMEVGRGVGAAFERSGEFDFLFFKDVPPPISSDGKFMNPPKKDEPVAADSLWWDWNPPINPGVKPGELARFWLGINVPRGMFENGMATFTLRQHASIPEPATLVLWSAGLIGLALTARRRR